MMVYISLLSSVSHRSVDCSDPETLAADSGGQALASRAWGFGFPL